MLSKVELSLHDAKNSTAECEETRSLETGLNPVGGVVPEPLFTMQLLSPKQRPTEMPVVGFSSEWAGGAASESFLLCMRHSTGA